MHLGTMSGCIFLDRDGVLNRDNPNYTYRVSDFEVLPGVPEALYLLKEAGFRLVVVTNQSGVAQRIYTHRHVRLCHIFLQQGCGHVIDAFYYSPYHPSVTASLARKPGTLMFEKAIARFSLQTQSCWMVGDRGRDIIPARALGIKTIQVGDEIEKENQADYKVDSLLGAAKLILNKQNKKGPLRGPFLRNLFD